MSDFRLQYIYRIISLIWILIWMVIMAFNWTKPEFLIPLFFTAVACIGSLVKYTKGLIQGKPESFGKTSSPTILLVLSILIEVVTYIVFPDYVRKSEPIVFILWFLVGITIISSVTLGYIAFNRIGKR